MFQPFPLSMRLSTACAGIFAVTAAILCVPASASTYTVGPPNTLCSHTDIQSALNAAESHAGADTVRIVHALTGTGMHGSINTAQDLTIDGGYATCRSATPDGGRTAINAAGATAYKVLSITSTGVSTIRLQHLQIRGGYATNNGYGGGIYFKGQGNLELTDTLVDHNRGGYGGGIYFEATNATAKLTLGADNLISLNTADISGGGIYIQNAKMDMTAAGSSIIYNTAVQYGGGLRIFGDSTVTVGSGGYSGVPAIYSNSAAYGGGVAVQGRVDAGGHAYFYLTSGASIDSNSASASGGGIYLQNYRDFDDVGDVDANISGGSILDSNTAPEAAAVYVGHDSPTIGAYRGSAFYMSNASLINNSCLNTSGQPTGGAIIRVSENGRSLISRTLIGNNSGGTLLRTDGTYDSDLTLNYSLITGNTLQRGLVEVQSNGNLRVLGSTIAGNTLGGTAVFTGQAGITMEQSIAWQPGKITSQLTGARSVDDVVASDVASLPTSASVIYADPRFIDPAHNDYHLQAASPAVDFSGVITTSGVDGQVHNKDMGLVANRYGAGDLGAYEVQSIGNLVLDPGFIVDLRLWNPVMAGISTWVASGASSAGSVTISKALVIGGGSEIIGLSQCVHIPGPGTYELSGFAHGGSASSNTQRDHPVLRWRLRNNPGVEDCFGTVNAEGNVSFPSGPNFAASTSPGEISVPAASWTRFTSVEILLVVDEGGFATTGTTEGSFDGIVLQALDDRIFANGFEP